MHTQNVYMCMCIYILSVDVCNTHIRVFILFFNLYSFYPRPQLASLHTHCFPLTQVQVHHRGAAPLDFSSLCLHREIIVTTIPCQGPKALWGNPVFWLAENKREVYREGHKYTCCIFMSQFPVEPAANCIFGFHLTYPFLHCGLLLPVCLRDFISQICWLFYVCLFFCKKCPVVTLAIYTSVILPPKMW